MTMASYEFIIKGQVRVLTPTGEATNDQLPLLTDDLTTALEEDIEELVDNTDLDGVEMELPDGTQLTFSLLVEDVEVTPHNEG
jgi:hypothetical protein